MGRGPKPDRKEPSMSLAEFYELVGQCTDDEIDRLRSRYRRYYRWHRQVFTDLLSGNYTSEKEFFDAALDARDEASKQGQTSASVPEGPSKTRRAGLARTNRRKLVKLATRILYLRMTAGAGNVPGGKTYAANPLPDDRDPPLTPSEAKKRLVEKMENWGVGYDAIRKEHTPFQSEE